MKYTALIIGLGIMFVSLLGMAFFHEFQVSEITFIVGVVITGIAYAKIPHDEKPVINMGNVNKNTQIYNDILWGKQEKDDDFDTIEIKIKRGK